MSMIRLHDVTVYVCTCDNFYSGEPTLDLFTYTPTKDECHQWDCKWRPRYEAWAMATMAERVTVHDE